MFYFIKSLFTQKNIQPLNGIDLIFSKSMWNHHELAINLDIASEQAKKLLKNFGYKYDNKKMMYVSQPISDELREKFLKVNVLDID